LQQIVSQTWEAGVRGEKATATERLNWSVGYFRTLNINDILTVQSDIIGRSSFQNAGDSLREGVEAKIDYRTDRLFTYASYSFVNATFLSNLVLSSPFNPFADENGDIFVHPGDHLPGIPAHTFKTGFDYGLTRQLKFGADFIAVSGQYFQGDESNQNPQLGGYAKVNIHTSYDVNEHIQLYGLVNNLFNAHYGTFGNFFALDDANSAALGSIVFTDPRAITPAPPLTAYGGLKVHF
jgi:outer membrane receptor protein involved in Fe transport